MKWVNRKRKTSESMYDVRATCIMFGSEFVVGISLYAYNHLVHQLFAIAKLRQIIRSAVARSNLVFILFIILSSHPFHFLASSLSLYPITCIWFDFVIKNTNKSCWELSFYGRTKQAMCTLYIVHCTCTHTHILIHSHTKSNPSQAEAADNKFIFRCQVEILSSNIDTSTTHTCIKSTWIMNMSMCMLHISHRKIHCDNIWKNCEIRISIILQWAGSLHTTKLNIEVNVNSTHTKFDSGK